MTSSGAQQKFILGSMTSPSIYFSDCRAFPKCLDTLGFPLSCNSPETDPKRSESFRISFCDGFDDLFQKHKFLRQLMSITTMSFPSVFEHLMKYEPNESYFRAKHAVFTMIY